MSAFNSNFSKKQIARNFGILAIHIIIFTQSCDYFLETYEYKWSEDTVQPNQQYELVIERSYEAEVGSIAIITAIPERVRLKYDVHKVKKTNYKADWLKILFWAPLCYVSIETLLTSDTVKVKDWIVPIVITSGLIYSVAKHNKSKIEKSYAKTYSKIKISAVGRSAHLEFTTTEGIKKKIFLGKFNDKNKLTVNLWDLVDSPIHHFRNLEEALNYFSYGKIVIDWQIIQLD